MGFTTRPGGALPGDYPAGAPALCARKDVFMAGGKWVFQNKVRPGAYINFKAAAKGTAVFGERGVMTLPAPLKWGPEGSLIRLYASDMLDGASLSKVGVTAFDAGSLLLREALRGCHTALVWRADRGGAKAKATLGTLTATAKWGGTLGNALSVRITKSGESFVVTTLLSGAEKDSQTAAAIAELKANDFVVFSGTGALAVNAGAALSGGTDGTVTESVYTAYFEALASENWNTLAMPVKSKTAAKSASDFIKAQREAAGKCVQAVLCDYPEADHEGIISVDQGFYTSSETVDETVFTATVASLTAGASVAESLTRRVIEGAADIALPIAQGDIESALKAGRFILTKRQDGAVVCEQDINTLHQNFSGKDYAFSKNRIVRCLDAIGADVALLFERDFIGRVSNSGDGRELFKSGIISYLSELEREGAITELDGVKDVTVNLGDRPDCVTCELAVRPADSLEKLYMTVSVG